MSKGRYTHVKNLLPEVQRLRAKGLTRREIATQLCLPNEIVIKNLLTRERIRAENMKDGQPPKHRGRKPAVTLQDYKYECKRLKMENELLRDFLHLAGRR